ncbi:MAG: carboxypeptidase-like regulatory domain-containing protein [Bacteroidia bacterium]|nr:carboxypeptidase-like regulatory domain-containing protein [Bacteroidia bacterium]
MRLLICIFSPLISFLFSYGQIASLRDASGKIISKGESEGITIRSCFNKGFTFTVCDSLTKEPLPFVTAASKDKTFGTCTDFDGNFKMQIIFIDGKKYCTKDFTLSYIGYERKEIKCGYIKDTIFLKASELQLKECVIVNYCIKPVVDLPTKIISHQTNSASLPDSPIEEITIIIDGIPKDYGDATGSLIHITTRNDSLSTKTPAANPQEEVKQELNMRNCRRPVNYYIDGVRIKANENKIVEPDKKDLKQIEIITGGLPGTFGDSQTNSVPTKKEN